MPMAIEISGNLSKNLVRMAEGHEMTSASDRMTEGAGGLVRHRPVDGFRHQFVVTSPPEVDRSSQCNPIEWPGFESIVASVASPSTPCWRHSCKASRKDWQICSSDRTS